MNFEPPLQSTPSGLTNLSTSRNTFLEAARNPSHHSLLHKGSPPAVLLPVHRRGATQGDLLAVMNVFTADLMCNPAVNTVRVFAAISYTETAVKTFSTAGYAANARCPYKSTMVRSFIAGLKMEGHSAC